jgi:hypothetical protein
VFVVLALSSRMHVKNDHEDKTLTYDLHLTILLPIDEAGWVIQPQASLNEVQSLWRSLEGNQGHELLEGLRKSHMTKDQKGVDELPSGARRPRGRFAPGGETEGQTLWHGKAYD